jgi:hypothetical protein
MAMATVPSKKATAKAMRTLLATCAFLAALVGPAGARAHASPCARSAQTDTGFLDVDSDPPAKIFVDDVDFDKVTPQHHLELVAGHHKLKLVTLDGARKRTIGFTIEPGQTRKLTVYLSP